MKNYILPILAFSLITLSCTDLVEELKSDLPEDKARAFLNENVNFDVLLETVYREFDSRYIQHAGSVWLLQEVSADAAIVPSRPSGWDNGGVYRELHTHSWTPENAYIIAVWNGLNRGIFNATNVLSFNPSDAVAAEARFLRAFFMYTILDLFNQVPFREPGDDLLLPSTVLTGGEAVEFIIDEVKAALPLLATTGPAYRATQNAARALLAKLYLNKAVYYQRSNPQFDAQDMQRVIAYADEITEKSLDFYWDSFVPDNNLNSNELIFTIEGRGGVRSHSLWVWWHAIFPTEMILPNGGGWNGFASTPEVYDLFEANDVRRYYEHPITVARGYNAGFLTGQQFDPNGDALPGVVFTKEIPTLVGATLWNGYRPVKYIPDYANPGAADNDVVLLRYADVLLMKAEALLRLGDTQQALQIVNLIRTERNASEFQSLDLDLLLDERARELYWEGHRRQDMIRFGKFLGSWTLKTSSSDQYLLFTIPPADVLANPNLDQTPGF
ncbi:RagB/SusD family nutrient uptake outer membrane protein [Belliella sp. DSM 111904]|uniref:RagB/SusD family nutrient uptake outer membrane protein n=1 Tax=Belliella filtrata TaxID=2923435 RepID=A0ABS9UVP9_9BACT|nr:RagB/SusD family nutrient uptake outer membrane protein [Belliella filtrata]MCH7408118.1 RagB/SusD family nutrient uptake outer membrane protein [Belliella filtrata]